MPGNIEVKTREPVAETPQKGEVPETSLLLFNVPPTKEYREDRKNTEKAGKEALLAFIRANKLPEPPNV